MLLFGAAFLFGLHPGALAQAADDYDAALSAARAIATTSGNGATLVFAPRSGRTSGFELRVYSGRPTQGNAVTETTVMPVVSGATVAETTLGAPPFAIFLGASGDVSGRASYPSIDAAGTATFAKIAREPACPSGGFTLVFADPNGASKRRLPCIASTLLTSPMPNPSPTPNVPLATPPLLVYHWPAAPQQSFVATEFGYTHWFATTNGFDCGRGVAQFPDVLPWPYSSAYTQAEADATPSPPSGTPYSYPNSGGGSTNDAPARFPLDPAAAGLCTAAVVDDFGQRAQSSVQVMGWLTLAYNAKLYQHDTSPQLSLPSSSFGQKGAAVTLPVSKTYDAEPLQPHVALDAACAPYVTVAAAGGTTPSSPSAAPATASITLALASMPQSRVSCGGVVYDQYAGSRNGEGVFFNATIAPASPQTWPAAVQYPLAGFAISPCAANQPRAYTDDTFGTPDKNDAAAFGGQGADGPYGTDANGCMLYNKGQTGEGPIDMTDTHPGRAVSVLVNEPGYGAAGDTFKQQNVLGKPQCALGAIGFNWDGSDAGPTANLIGIGESAQSTCYFALTDSSGTVNTNGSNTVAVQVTAPCTAGVSCFAESKGEWDTWASCPGVPDCKEYRHIIDQVWDSTDGGAAWSKWQNRALKTLGCASAAYKSGFTGNEFTGTVSMTGSTSLVFSYTWSPTPPAGYGLPSTQTPDYCTTVP